MKRFKIKVFTAAGYIDFFVWNLNSQIALYDFLNNHMEFLENEIIVLPD